MLPSCRLSAPTCVTLEAARPGSIGTGMGTEETAGAKDSGSCSNVAPHITAVPAPAAARDGARCTA